MTLSNCGFNVGDILRFTSIPTHYAVYIGDEEIVHYNKRDHDTTRRIIREKLAVYKKRVSRESDEVQKSILTRDATSRPFQPSEIKERALSCVGKEDYNAIIRNCEHFVMWCVYGKATSINARVAVMGVSTAITAAVGGGTGVIIGGAIGSIVPVAGTLVGSVVGGFVGTGVGASLGIVSASLGWLVRHITRNNENFDFD